MFFFDPIHTAQFLSRPNRFIVRCELDDGSVVDAHLPNPGRLWELFFSGVPIHLLEHDSSSNRKTRYTVVAVEREEKLVMLHTSMTNQVARYLLETNRIPSLSGSRIIKPEYKLGRSRFDFLIEHKGQERLLEVKSCTLFGNRIAMFPDAVTERGRRHLLELADLSKYGAKPVVMFVISWPEIDWFMPDYHTDIEFSRTLLDVSSDIDIIPVSVGWNRDLSLQDETRVVPIPWDFLKNEVDDRGAYLLLLHLKKTKQFEIGSLGVLRFPAGHYIYVGSAMKNLSKRIARHKRRAGKGKKQRWHIDYLREAADEVRALPIVSSKRQECELADSISAIGQQVHKGFGCSDCRCDSHLFLMDMDPLHSPSFHALLQRFRMRNPHMLQA